jgi:hypothetical protein
MGVLAKPVHAADNRAAAAASFPLRDSYAARYAYSIDTAVGWSPPIVSYTYTFAPDAMLTNVTVSWTNSAGTPTISVNPTDLFVTGVRIKDLRLTGALQVASTVLLHEQMHLASWLHFSASSQWDTWTITLNNSVDPNSVSFIFEQQAPDTVWGRAYGFLYGDTTPPFTFSVSFNNPPEVPTVVTLDPFGHNLPNIRAPAFISGDEPLGISRRGLYLLTSGEDYFVALQPQAITPFGITRFSSALTPIFPPLRI